MELLDIINTIIDAVAVFVVAIQWAFDFLANIITSFYTVWNFVTSALSFVYSFSSLVPSWLWSFPLAYISFRLVVFVKNIGGD